MVELEIKHPEFAKRLNDAMRAADVSVTDLKNHLKVTYEMARRYTMGVAMPRDDKLVAIARRIGVQTAWLKFGDAVPVSKGERNAASKPSVGTQPNWPLKKATPERFHALTAKQRVRADAAIDDLLRGYEAERNNKNF